MHIDWGKVDWTGLAAAAGVLVTALTAVVGGLATRSRNRRFERLVAVAKEMAPESPARYVVERMILDHAERMDFRQRGPKQRLRTALYWSSQILGWALVVGLYFALLWMIQPLINAASSFPTWLWYASVGAAIAASILLVCGDLVRSGSADQRASWIKLNPALPPAGAKRRGKR